MEGKYGHSIPLDDRRWVLDPQGAAHAIRASEGEHHSAMCGKYVRSATELHTPGKHSVCPDCLSRLRHPIPGALAAQLPSAIAQGRGVNDGLIRRGRGPQT